MNNIGLYVFSALVLGGLTTLVWLKIRWSKQASRKWAAITASHAAFK